MCNAGVENGDSGLLERARVFSRNGLFAMVFGSFACLRPRLYLLQFLSFLRYDT